MSCNRGCRGPAQQPKNRLTQTRRARYIPDPLLMSQPRRRRRFRASRNQNPEYQDKIVKGCAHFEPIVNIFVSTSCPWPSRGCCERCTLDEPPPKTTQHTQPKPNFRPPSATQSRSQGAGATAQKPIHTDLPGQIHPRPPFDEPTTAKTSVYLLSPPPTPRRATPPPEAG